MGINILFSHFFLYSFDAITLGENRVLELNTDYDYKSNGYKISKENDGLYVVAKAAHYFSKHEADLAAESLHQEIMQENSFFCLNSLESYNINFKEWCQANSSIYKEFKHRLLKISREHGLDKIFPDMYSDENLERVFESDRLVDCDDLKYFLEKTNNFDLLSKLWKDTIGSFAGICEIHIGKKSYLTIDENLPDIVTTEQGIKELASSYYEYPEHYEYNGYEESEIDLLIESLNNPELKVRATAYELLINGLKTPKIKLAIAKGLLLNPGDRIYSVWQAGIRFDDQAYYLIYDSCDLNQELVIKENSELDYINDSEFDEDYLAPDYFEEEYELSEDDYQDPEIESYESFFAEYIKQDELIEISDRQKRIWDELEAFDIETSISYEIGCLFASHYICQNRAEAIAESLHQKSIKKHDIWSFRWEKINDLEAWCIANNVPYQKKCYDDPNEDSTISTVDREHLMNYLQQPKNINLLSKLWKDAVGNFAFVCEQTVENQTYLKIDVNYQY
jgi:hypothetical protein